ncbi:hypothetical protein Tco_0913665 [Tanacetum coccineum]
MVGFADTFVPNDKGNAYPYTRSSLTSDGSEDNIATSMGENIAFEGIVPSSSSGLNTQDLPKIGSQVQPAVRRSSRPLKMPPKFNDYIVRSNVKELVDIVKSRVRYSESGVGRRRAP